MKNAEFSYYRYRNGDMEEGLWQAMRNGALRPFETPAMRTLIWPSIRLQLSPEFVHYMEDAIQKGEHKRLEDPYGPVGYDLTA